MLRRLTAFFLLDLLCGFAPTVTRSSNESNHNHITIAVFMDLTCGDMGNPWKSTFMICQQILRGDFASQCVHIWRLPHFYVSG